MINKLLVLVVFVGSILYSQDGFDYYFGLGVEKNYGKALSLLQSDGYSTSKPLLIIMYLNGDGTEQNPGEALKVWDKSTKSGFIDVTMSGLKKIIDERLSNPKKSFSKLTYCEIAMTTVDMNICGSIRNKLKEQELRRTELKITQNFNEEQKELYKKIQSNYQIIEKNDSDRMYNLNIEGTIRGMAFSGMESYLKERNEKRIKKLLVSKNIPSFTQEDFIKADQDLNKIYKQQKDYNSYNFQEMIDIFSDEPSRVQYYKNLILEVNNNLKFAQRAWIKYRDDWATLLSKLYPNKKNIVISIKTYLTRERNQELKYDPIGM